MATAVEPQVTQALQGEHRFLLRGVGWEGYEALLAMVGDGHVRLTCDGKDVELMSPFVNHEEYASLMGRIVETVNEILELPYRGLRCSTWRKQGPKVGLEADQCYYLANLPAVRGLHDPIDLNVVPPPDLAIDIEISPSDLDRLDIYAKLGIPEIWRFDGTTLTFHRLKPSGEYASVATSPGVPAITPAEVLHWTLHTQGSHDHSAWARELRRWVRAEILPRRQRGL